MENNKGPIWKNSLSFGLMTGMVLIIYNVILYVFDLNLNKSLGWLAMVIIIAGIIIGTKSFRDKMQNGSISYGRALGSGTLISLFTGIIAGIYTYVLMTYIDTDIMKNIYLQMEEQFIEQGIPDDQIEMMMDMSKKFSTPTMIAIFTPFNYGFMGFLFSLIISAFLKKKGDPFASAMTGIENETEEN